MHKRKTPLNRFIPRLIPIRVKRNHTRVVKLYHKTQLYSLGSNSRPMIKLRKTSTIYLYVRWFIFIQRLKYLFAIPFYVIHVRFVAIIFQNCFRHFYGTTQAWGLEILKLLHPMLIKYEGNEYGVTIKLFFIH